MQKQFIPELVLKCGSIVDSKDYGKILSSDPVPYAKDLANQNADALFIRDLSETDAEHDEAIGIIKQICLNAEVDVYATGHIFRMEDVKKLLYAGCHKVLINLENPTESGVLEEVSKKFGKEKIVACLSNADSLKNSENVTSLVNALAVPANLVDMEADVPVYIYAEAASSADMESYLSKSNVAGIIGTAVNAIAEELTGFKHTLFTKGVEVITFEGADDFSTFKLNNDGLIPVVTQDYRTNEVLMVAYMNREAYEETLRTGKMCYYSRSRQSQWLKGETSGHFQYVKELYCDCDRDTILAKVSQVGVACHTGAYSCFFNELASKDCGTKNPAKVFDDVMAVIMDRKIHPKEGSYTNYLFDKGLDKILKKVGEEATEIVIASKNPNPDEIKYEIADFLYHMMVLMAERGVTWQEITDELARR